jgi:glycosyltransferase involved in cell wall biosynthesis
MRKHPIKRVVVAGPSGQTSGLETHTNELVKFLVSQGYEVVEVRVLGYNDVASRYDNCFVISSRLGFLGKLCKILDWIRAIYATRRFSPDLLVCTAIGDGYRWLSRFAGSHCYSIIQVVTDDYPVKDCRMQTILKSYNAVGAQTLTLKQQIEAKLSLSTDCKVLPCFHQIYSTNLCTDSPDSPTAKIKLAYFGRLAENKGLSLLLEVFSNLKFMPVSTLDIWGSGSLESELENKIRSCHFLSQTVSLKGPYPSGGKYINLLSTYHGLVLPSQATEGLPLVLLEAASVGLPILTTRVGGIQDFANRNPDVVIVDIGYQNLCSGLTHFLNCILDETIFDRRRLQELFARNYSRSSIESIWTRMLANPLVFFRV